MSENLPSVIDFSDPKTIATLKATVAKDTTNEEFAMFAALCSSSGLNPFKKEIWCIVIPEKSWNDRNTGERREKKRQVQIMTGLNGFYEIANSDPAFDGIEHGLVGPDGALLPQSYPKGDFVGAWCKVYRKDRGRPHEEVVMLAEYAKPDWKMPRTMIIKCADSVGLRKSFPQKLNGLYTAEEMPPEYGGTTIEAKETPPVKNITMQGGVQTKPAIAVKVADELPKPKAIYHYMINAETVGADRLPAAMQILQKAGAEPMNEFGLFVSKRKIKQFDDFEINEDE